VLLTFSLRYTQVLAEIDENEVGVVAVAGNLGTAAGHDSVML
jgi:hypothetical protein